jgi:hypothetical protein
VLPYYLHLLDHVAGAAHFEVSEPRVHGCAQRCSRACPVIWCRDSCASCHMRGRSGIPRRVTLTAASTHHFLEKTSGRPVPSVQRSASSDRLLSRAGLGGQRAMQVTALARA